MKLIFHCQLKKKLLFFSTMKENIQKNESTT